MLEIIGIFLCLAIFLALFGSLVAMAVFPLVRQPSEPTGPWVIVNDNGEGVALYGLGGWGWTSVPEHVQTFAVRSEAEDWATLTGGEVKAESEVVW